jgi:hypothetical protein
MLVLNEPLHGFRDTYQLKIKIKCHILKIYNFAIKSVDTSHLNFFSYFYLKNYPDDKTYYSDHNFCHQHCRF